MKKKPIKSKIKKPIKKKSKKAKSKIKAKKDSVQTLAEASTSYVENEDFNFEIITVSLPNPKTIENTILKSVKSNFRRILSRLRMFCGRGGEEENSN